MSGNFSFVDFYDRRIRRLFPALFAMICAVTIWCLVYQISLDLRDYGASLASASLYGSNIYFFFATRGYFHQNSEFLPLLHTWSLAVEEQFYIVVPFALFALARATPRRWHVAAIGAGTAISLALCVWLSPHHDNATFFLLPGRAWELGLGALLAIGAFEFRNRGARELLAVAGLIAILFAVCRFTDSVPFPGWRAAIPAVGAAAILSAGLSGSIVSRVLSTRPLTFIGKISYSLYLWHWPVILAFTYGAARPTSVWTSLQCVLVALLLGVLSWYFVERPFRIRRLLPDASSLFSAAAFGTIAAVAVGMTLYFTDGLPGRQPPQLIRLLYESQLPPARGECHYVNSTRARADDLCVRGASAMRPTFVLAGDSHAEALADGLFAAAAKRGVSGIQFTNSAFAPLIGLYSLNGKPRDVLAPAFAIYLRRHTELRTIILIDFWSYYATGQNFRFPMSIYVDSGYDGSGAAYNPIAFRHGLERLAKSFSDRRFILLDDGPSGKDLDAREYARILYVNGRAPRGALSRATADAQRASYEPILKLVAASNSNVRYVPLMWRLCGRNVCSLFDQNGRLLYRDGDHLSRAASEALAPALDVVFEGK